MKMLNLNFVTPLRETASYKPSCVKISLVVFFCKGRQEKKEGKEREGKGTKSHTSVIFHIFVGKLPVNGFSPNFAHQETYST